jgi:signal transduction histidine kinase/AraC-like DNA-binding protein/ABC-type sugar transport system substrate-binding protein
MGLTATPADPPRPAWPDFSPEVDYVPIDTNNTDGLIVINPLHSPNRVQYVRQAAASGHPLLFVGAGGQGPTIRANNIEGTLDAMRHLIKHGHRRIAFLAGSPEDLDGDSGDRLNAFYAAQKLYGLEADPRLIVYGRHVYDGGYSAALQFLGSGAEFTAILASNDESAIGAMDALKAAGKRVPEDIAVIGFDDRLEGTVQVPSLTTIRIPLFNMGYRAVELLYHHLEGQHPLDEVMLVDTTLIRRESCGCGQGSALPSIANALPEDSESERPLSLSQAIAAVVLNQAQSLAEDECLSLCGQLVETLAKSIAENDPLPFQNILEHVLRRTVAIGDDATIWQDPLALLMEAYQTPQASLNDLLFKQAQLTISAHMQRQHRQYVVDQRWISSRLGLLTADLLIALDETSIYATLAKHLAEMNIHTALIGLFESGMDMETSTLRDATQETGKVARFQTSAFPPPGFLPEGKSFQLALLPLVQQNGQKGFVAFDTEHLDYYGDIVQQIAGALNSVRLYREALEGQRLAEEANSLKSRFLSTVSHELRTPLNLIVGLSGILLQESARNNLALPELSRRDIERIHSQAQHLGGLIGDVLDLASSDARQLRLNNEYVDLSQALRLVVETGRQLASEKGLAWEANLPDTDLWVWGDRVRLRQVALNLISNAVKFTAQGGVRLTLQTELNTATFAVHDTGLGIPPEEQHAIFDEFRQSERTVSRGFGGLGLGLAICKRLIEMHGGTIGVRSTGNEGEGSVFYFTLPLVSPPVVPSVTEMAGNAKEQSVLLLTTPTDTSERLRTHLDRRGFEVQMRPMDDLAGWQSALIETPPDAIVLDVSASSGQVWDILRTTVGNPAMQGIPLLFYTSNQENGTLLELDYLTKPIRYNELRRTLERVLPPAEEAAPGRTFLVVDDDPNTLEMHVRIVQAQAVTNRVLQARNGRDALQILNHTPVDLVLLDLMMPEMDGFEVLETMREQETTRDIPVIILTGRTLTEEDMARLNRGVSTVLSKGVFTVDETIIHISTALERKRKLNSETQRLVRQAMAYLHQHYAEPVSRHEIAQHVGLVEDYLTHCFRQELGMTPIAYLNRYRINQAKRLLKESEQPITEIASAVGFADSSYFSRIFRRETGTSPEAFRRG